MAILFQEMMLGDKDVVVAELVGKLDLLQRLVVDLEPVMFVPLIGVERSGRLQLEHNGELYECILLQKFSYSLPRVASGRFYHTPSYRACLVSLAAAKSVFTTLTPPSLGICDDRRLLPHVYVPTSCTPMEAPFCGMVTKN
jgi:hypothetical protein